MRHTALGVAVVLGLVWFAAPTARADELVIPGTGACEAVLRRLAAAYMAARSGDRVTVPSSVGSGGGIRAVREGDAALARVARPLTGEERAAGLVFRPFARDAVVFATGRDAGVDELTSGELVGVFSGVVRRWSERGGSDRLIRVFVREPGDACLSRIAAHLPWFRAPEFTSRSRMLYHDAEMVAMLETFGSGVGWLTGSTLAGHPKLRRLQLDGVAPTPAGVAGGSYPLAITYGFVHRSGRLPAAASRFLGFVGSAEGTRELEASGLVPVWGW
jgi:phosphate transport system substrate-binding protein